LNFEKRRVTGKPCPPFRNLGRTDPREESGCKTKKEEVEYRCHQPVCNVKAIR